ncbi:MULTISPECIES: SurA N-terminal domain-containing protein [unclassified Halomonas]|uniref:SurA N-terminal domain-containing protein n=1 Tax=unclassified Halomonas TaxID=2609666 RepID=UPI0028835A0D|nr:MULTISPECIES: SurA N-terminal domain-containing protein [unclassified Halomonas]MDT0502011.1 SurA N-terminal domain-containing protein [Halomonas sp. PAR7]MDT0511777.1 SurA N-terminal domain-containing protein [Halomonas sp. LES1]MDT0592110.1 SurA N-terminal domain-containing protein [Halomonas sp. PAR8]
MRSRRTPLLAAGLAMALGLAVVPFGTQAQEFTSSQRQALDHIVAVVNEGAIMHSQLEERIAQVRSQMSAQQQELPPERVLREQILEQMILEEIQWQMAEESGLTVDDTELNRQVRGIAERNGMSLEQFADALEADGLTLASVREEIRREITLRQLQQRRVGSRVSLSEREVERFMAQQDVTREQAQQALFQRKANAELEAWLQEIRSQAFVDNRLDAR